MLSYAQIIRESIEEEGKTFLALYIELKNACVLFLSEDAERLGTLAVSIPSRIPIRRPITSSVLLGDRNALAARLLAEKLANLTGKLALVSVSSRTLAESGVAQVFIRLMERILARKEVQK
ncbi:MAG TPA: hypothetical protein ENF42_03975 [Candidatus Bathyarchaeota archaeon]|nr:hypothetical protein [Candidatus Bathyarchaeota archaeon]